MVKNYFLDEVRFYNFIVNNHLSVLVFSQLCLLFFMQLVLSLFYKGSNHICLQGEEARAMQTFTTGGVGGSDKMLCYLLTSAFYSQKH